jgi:transposase
MTQTTIGIDISKDHLDAFILPDKLERRFGNGPSGFKALIAWIGDRPVERIVYEATGPYHRALERALGAKGLPLAKVNPRQARRFAEAAGQLAKTDRIDAALLARFGVALEPGLTPPPTQVLDDMRELHGARHALVKDRTAARNRAKNLRVPLLKRQNAQRLKQIDAQLDAIDQALLGLVASDETLKARFDILVSIPGLSTVSALALLIDLPELGDLNGKQAASLVGLAPMSRQSGTWTGRASIKGGRATLRQALYMPALVACRYNPDLKEKYKALIGAGKPAKVAITAVMRKIVVLANALIRDHRKWSETPA